MVKKPATKRKPRVANPKDNTRKPKELWPRILLGIPQERNCPGGAFYDFMAISYAAALAQFQGYQVAISEVPYGRTDVVRNKFAIEILKTDFTHLMMLDIDHKHPRDIIKRLARWVVQDPSRWVVGGLNFRRGAPYEACAFVKGTDGNYYSIVDWEPGLFRVDKLGTGSILIAREVFETIPPPWFLHDYSPDQIMQDIWPGEDMGFGDLCEQYGIAQWCDSTLTSPHLIDGVVDESVFRAYMKDHPTKIVDAGSVIDLEERKAKEPS